ncbi:RimJ/RimL family protein N-acetyltransferase [Rhodoblastus acidophilus]|uniref:GNAT family N-acetyltransferase n=1 Tax=Rhodoblastus acidophilus TaxID=1074 RepID=UPI0022250027|nr:GNAT family N-acetyltransferase [Rhodoblastus acidophilus]MCW2284864.1 RimJ/RimL family protein N-acetyltransferase [Rhodoblastus acidophilus]MCW2333846.1 RimJ/RimL family protein N-acetyltransferase [Rhodoblastus acidophilus]
MSAPKDAGTARADVRKKLFPDGFGQTERLLLEPLQPADAFGLVILTNDPLVAHGASTLPQPFTMDDARALIALPRSGGGCFAALRVRQTGGAREMGRGAGEMIGCAGILVREPERGDLGDLELGFWLGAPHHGRHYGAEAAQAMLERTHRAFPRARIVVECPPENYASWRLLRRMGFEPGAGKGSRKNAELLAWRAEAEAEA